MDQNLKDILDTVIFIKEHMLTKDEGASKADVEKLENRLIAVEGKIDGTNRRLDTEAMQRTDLKLPRRVHDLEEKLFGAGRSKHPKHVPL